MDVEAFKRAMGEAASGVVVVTSRDEQGLPAGATMTAFLSLSLDPPLVLISLANGTRTGRAIAASDHFAVHLLGAEQEALAWRFAANMEDKFAGLPTCLGAGGVPLIDGCAARLECQLTARYPGGDHEIFVGLVLAVETDTQAEPAVWWRRGLRRLADIEA